MYSSDVPCWSNLGQRCPAFNTQSTAFWLVLLAVLAAFFFDIGSTLRTWNDRLARLMYRSSLPDSIVATHLYKGRCLSMSMDYGQDMPGPLLFLRYCQLAFSAFLSAYRINDVLSSMKATLVHSSSNMKFRRPLHFLETFTIHTKIVWWDNNHIYVEQKLTRDTDQTLCAINLSRLTVQGAEPQEIFSALRLCSCRPELPPEIASWLVCIQVVNRELTLTGHF